MKGPSNLTLLIVALVVTTIPLMSGACSANPPNPTPGNSSGANEQPTPEPTQTLRKYSLREATDNKFARATLCGLGLSSGRAIVMAIKSAVSDRMEIRLDEGTTLTSSDPGAQDMVIERVSEEYDRETADEIANACVEAADREEKRMNSNLELSEGWKKTDMISLPPYETRVYLLRAYCLDFEKRNPSAETRFSLSDDANAETRKLFTFVRQNPTLNETAIQLATWAINGDHDPEEILEHFEFEESHRKNACSLLQYAGIYSSKKLCAD